MTIPSLTAVLSPLTRETFVRDVWGQRSHLSKVAGRDLSTLLSQREFFEAAARPRTITMSVFRGLSGEHRETMIPGRIAEDLYEAGTTICVADIGGRVERIGELARRLRSELGFAGQTTFNAYLSPPGEGFKLHFDAQHTVILQLHGSKRWRFGRRPACQRPTRNRLAEQLSERDTDITPPRDEDLVEATLEPGDVLYMAPGTWHDARSVDTSLALTLTLVPRRLSTLLVDVLRERLEALPGFGDDVPLHTGGDAPVDGRLDHLEGGLQSWLDDLPATALLRELEAKLRG